MGCIQARPSTLSPSRGLEKMKLENGYVIGKGGKGGGEKPVGEKKQFGKESNKLSSGNEGSNTKKNIVVATDAQNGKLIARQGGEGGGQEAVVGNISQRNTSKRHVVGGDDLVDGWPKWLTDNIPPKALVGLTPRSAESYDKLDKIGQGTYSNVYKARDRDSGKIVALKKVRFDTSEPESVRFMAREIMILQHLNHPHVLKLEGLATSRMQYSLYLVFDYMQTDLSRIISRPDARLTEPQVKCYMQQLLAGLQHCHEKGILHRDIKGSNLLIDRDGMLKIADFGLANYFDHKQKRPLTSRVVTLWYRAPELLLGATDYGVGIDLWSAGCLMAEMFAGRPIMPGRTEVEQLHRIFKLCGSPPEDYWKKLKLPASFRPPQPYKPSILEAFRDFPASSLGLMIKLLALDPSYRGTADSALQSEFFTTSPLACDLSGLPVIYKPEDEKPYTTSKIRRRASKLKQRSRTQREGQRRKDLVAEKLPKGDSGSSKEDHEKIEPIFHSQELGSSTGSTSSSVKPGRLEDCSPPILSLHRKESPKTEGHPQATKNITNPPSLPSTKNNEGNNSKYRLTLDRRSVSTRDFRQSDGKKLPKRYGLEDLDV